MFRKRHKWKRSVAFLLTMLLCCSLVMTAFATTESENETVQQETGEALPRENGPAEENGEKSPLECWADRVDFLNNQESALDVEYIVPQSQEVQEEWNQWTTFAAGDHTYNNVALHVIAKIQLEHPFYMPNGSLREALDCFAMDLDGNGKFGLNERTYCLDPYTDIAGGAHYDSVETPAASNVESPWGRLSAAKQRAVGLALLYGHGSDVGYGDMDHDIYDHLATQIIIHEIVLGYRQETAPYTCTNPIYINAVMSGARFTSGIWVDNGWVYGQLAQWELDRIKSTYDDIARKMASHTTPSFTSGRPQTAPTYTMEPMGNGKYQITLTDSKNVLFNCTFPNIPGLTFSKKGNQLTITAGSIQSIPSSAIQGTVGVKPNPDRSSYLVWSGTPASGTTQDQICVKAGGVQTDPVPAYFKLKAPPYGKIIIHKTTDDGGNLSGWMFDVRTTSGRRIGTFTTDSSGQVTVDGLLPDAYVVEEIGNEDHDMTISYQCTSINPQTVTVRAGDTEHVSFNNRQIAHIKILKTMATDGPLEGWKFKVTDSRGVEVPGSPFTSNAEGEITAWNLKPGQYTVEELIPADSPYYCKSNNPQTITAAAGKTAAVSFTNALKPGKMELVKLDLHGQMLKGATFCLEWSEDGSHWEPVFYSASPDVVKGGCSNADLKDGCLTTDETARLEWANLYPNLFYRLTEVEAPEGYQLLADTAWEGKLSDPLELSLHVVNAPVFQLPATGASDMRNIPLLLAALAVAFLASAYILRGKED